MDSFATETGESIAQAGQLLGLALGWGTGGFGTDAKAHEMIVSIRSGA